MNETGDMASGETAGGRLPPRVPYGQFLRDAGYAFSSIRYGELAGCAERGRRNGCERGVRWRQAWLLIRPYAAARLSAQVRSILPVIGYLLFFYIFVLRLQIHDALRFAVGIGALVCGLAAFLDGLKIGLMPFAEETGIRLSTRCTTAVVLAVAFVLGIVATLAEPAVVALQQGRGLSRPDTGLLDFLLARSMVILVPAVAVGVGLATVLGMLRFLRGWPLRPLLFLTALPTLALTGWAALEPSGLLRPVIGLAWDCGAITTGPVTVPLVLGLGMGLARNTSGGARDWNGLGVVALASIVPAAAVMGAAALCLAPAAAGAGTMSGAHSHAATGVLLHGLRVSFQALAPLLLVLVGVHRLVLRMPIQQPVPLMYGAVLCLFGMVLFNAGLALGPGMLGNDVGRALPVLFADTGPFAASALHGWLGLPIVLVFAFLLGFGATLAEPALKALALSVEEMTSGAIDGRSLTFTVSVGVGGGVLLGVARAIWQWDLTLLLAVLYGIALLLVPLQSERMAAIAWDCGGVTTGPVTVPLVMAIGLGLGLGLGGGDGFGILALASACPIVAVQAVGCWQAWRRKRNRGAVGGPTA